VCVMQVNLIRGWLAGYVVPATDRQTKSLLNDHRTQVNMLVRGRESVETRIDAWFVTRACLNLHI